jgi:hypothetical protein
VLQTVQVQALTTDDIANLTTTQVQAFTTAQVQALTTSQIGGITTTDIPALTTSQVGALTTTQVMALSSSQVGAFTTVQVSHLNLATPIILDLKGNGALTQSINAGVSFDLYNNGQSVSTGWVAPGDGLLVLPRGSDGQITNGSELFGSATTLANGQLAPNGYVALGQYDTNADGVINSSDSIFSQLRVWVNTGPAGTANQGELLSLSQLGIVSLNLSTSNQVSQDNGNIVGLSSSYTTATGATGKMADVWFVSSGNPAANASEVASLTIPEAASLSTAQVSAFTSSEIRALTTSSIAALSTADVHALSATQLGALTSTQVQALSKTDLAVLSPQQLAALGETATAGDGALRGRVSRLTQAIVSFHQASAQDTVLTGTGQDAIQGTPGSALSSNSMAVSRLVGAMKRYEDSANLLNRQPSTLAAAPDGSGSLENEAHRLGLLATPGRTPPRLA